METYFIYAGMISMFLILFGSQVINNYIDTKALTECRIEGMKAGKNSEQIEKICHP